MIKKLARAILADEIAEYERYLSYSLFYLEKNNIKPALQKRIERLTYRQNGVFLAGVMFPEELAANSITTDKILAGELKLDDPR